MRTTSADRLWATSDLHIAYPENREIVERLRPAAEGDWLIVAGDVAETAADIEWALKVLSQRFAKVVWAPGNHELWTPRQDAMTLRGVARYEYLVEMCRGLGVVTPEDAYPLWDGVGGPAIVAPLHLLYDYSFRVDGAADKKQSLALAYEAGVVCSDEFLLHTDPYPAAEDWCRQRVAATAERLAACPTDVPLVLVNHFPLVRDPTRILRYPLFAQWCGTTLTADWHRRFNTAAVIYGHLHIPRTTWYDGVCFQEVSVGYPREWRRRDTVPPNPLRQVLPPATPDESAG